MTKILFKIKIRKWIIQLEFKKADLWIGIFPKRNKYKSEIWIILPPLGIPCFPIHIIKERISFQRKFLCEICKREIVVYLENKEKNVCLKCNR